MNRILRIDSPCKLNLHLEVGKKREDGFHPLTSIFHLCSLSDRITISLENEQQQDNLIDLTMLNGPDIPAEKNLAWKAAELFFELSGNRFPVKIEIEKKVPDGGGLGGGSSNAAAVLAGLNHLCGRPIDYDELFRESVRLGSDVPFFIKNGAAHVTGRGDVVESLPALPSIPVVIVVPELHISTAKAFSLLDKEDACALNLHHGYVKSYLEGVPSQWPFYNSFQAPLFEQYEILSDALEHLKSCGADFCMMSGSGSALFGLFLSNEKAILAEKRLKKDFKQVYRKKLIEKFQNWL